MRKEVRAWNMSFAEELRLVAIVLLGLTLLGGCLSAPTAGSIGVVFSHDAKTRTVHIHSVADGRAAEQAGILPGDRVKMVDGVLVDELDMRRLRKLLRGAVGSKVTLTLLREDEVIHIELTRTPHAAKTTVRSRRERVE